MEPLIIFLVYFVLDVLIEFVLRWNNKRIDQCNVQNDQNCNEIPKSEIGIELEQLQNELKQMEEQAVQYNTTDTFAKYSKLQRQMIPKKQKIEQLQQEYNKEIEEYKKQMEQKRDQIEKPKDYKKYIKGIQIIILVISVLITKGKYFIVKSISYDQLYPINYLIAKEVEDDPYSIQIAYSFWIIQCFNFFRISKEQLKLMI